MLQYAKFSSISFLRNPSGAKVLFYLCQNVLSLAYIVNETKEIETKYVSLQMQICKILQALFMMCRPNTGSSLEIGHSTQKTQSAKDNQGHDWTKMCKKAENIQRKTLKHVLEVPRIISNTALKDYQHRLCPWKQKLET